MSALNACAKILGATWVKNASAPKRHLAIFLGEARWFAAKRIKKKRISTSVKIPAYGR